MVGVSKEYKNKLVNWILTKLKSINLSDKTIAFFVRSLHMNLPMYYIVIMVYGSKLINMCLLGFLICASISFIVFDGCILSKIEYEMDGLDVTLVDPLLEIMYLDTTNENRMNISIAIAFCYMTLAFSIYFIRFGSELFSSGDIVPIQI
jgi:hypothetical protein